MTIKPSTIFTGDNLPILRGMDDACVDLIYLDPPFNSNRNYAAPIGSKAAGAEFKDVWTLDDTDDAWWGELADAHPALYRVIDAAGAAGGKSNKSYCIYMAIRLLEMHRVLKPTGSLYLHCDPTMSHSLKLVLDAIFGSQNYRNEIVWSYSGWNKRLTSKFESRHDILYFYAKGKNNFNGYSLPWDSEKEYIEKRKQKVRQDENGRKYVLSDAGGGKRVKRYIDDAMQYGAPVASVWDIDKINNSSKERTGYPTQKPLSLLKRIVAASSNEGDVVLDPFCGCATACLAAESLRRKWVGIDISSAAFKLINARLKNELGGIFSRVIHRTDIPQRIGGIRSKDIKHILFGRQEGLCYGCKSSFEFRNFEVDHITPRADGGTDDDGNLQLLCGWCNRKKGKKSMAHLIAELKKEGIL